jgi:hypothetical protein
MKATLIIGAALIGALASCPCAFAVQGRGPGSPDAPRTRPRAAAPEAMAEPQSPAPQGAVTVRASLDRTALFVGDRLTYTVELTCTRGTDVLADDLSREKLKLEGLDLIGSDTEREAGGDDTTRYTVRYSFATYRVDLPALKIAPFDVRYYVRRPGQRPEEVAPAGSVQVPGAAVAFRSTLPEAEGWHQIRDSGPIGPRPVAFRLLQPVGIGLIVVAIAPVALLAIAIGQRVRDRRRSAAARSRRRARHEARELLDSVRAADPATPDARREAFDRLDALVRDHLADACRIDARSLTPEEIATALGSHGSRLPPDLVKSLLAQCELARYAPPDQLPAPDAWRRALADAEQVLAKN